MFVLRLNPVTGKAEEAITVACAESEQELKDFVLSQKVEVYYSDAGYRKSFKKDSPIEWMNPPHTDWTFFMGQPCIVDIGTRDTWANTAAQNFDKLINSIHKV